MGLLKRLRKLFKRSTKVVIEVPAEAAAVSALGAGMAEKAAVDVVLDTEKAAAKTARAAAGLAALNTHEAKKVTGAMLRPLRFKTYAY